MIDKLTNAIRHLTSENDQIAQVDENAVLAAYRESVLTRTIQLGRIASVLSLFLPLFFYYQDIAVLSMPGEVLYWRLLPVATGIITGCVAFTGLRDRPVLVNVTYFIFLESLMVMMFGLYWLSLGTRWTHAMMMGLIALVLIIYVGSPRGSLYLGAVFLPPLAVSMVLFGIAGHDLVARWIDLSNPTVVMVVVLFLASFQERMRFGRFRAIKIIEYDRILLEEQNRTIVTRNTQLNEDLKLARRIQQDIIPSRPPRRDGIEIAALFEPMEEIGGDFYDFIQFRDRQKLGLFIGDVSGHGIPASLITIMVKTLITTAGAEKLQPSRLLCYLNDRITGQTNNNFVTAFYGVYDIDARILTYSRAGHTYPYLLRGDAITQLAGRGITLGFMPGREYAEYQAALEPGDRLLLYTDGLTEGCNEKGEFFYEKLEKALMENSGRQIHGFLQSLYNTLIEFKGNDRLDDDVCMVAMDVTS